MTRVCLQVMAVLCCVWMVSLVPAEAQVAALGKGFLLDTAGSITTSNAEVISGRSSIRGSYTGPREHVAFLVSDASIIRFAPRETYTISLSYRIITPASLGVEFGFFSPTGSREGRFVRSEVIRGPAGASGTASLRVQLESYSDYTAVFKFIDTGAIVIDDIRITDDGGRVVAAEYAEGPTLARGPLNFQITDATSFVTESNGVVRSAAAGDLDGDGYPEAILTLTDHLLTTTPIKPIVIEARGRMRVATDDFFPSGAPRLKHSALTFFSDINGDGLKDILFGESGSDVPPWAGSVIGVALNVGAGKYRDVSSMVPADLQDTRSVALVAGDIDGDGRVEILLPDENGGSNTALLRWNGNGFDAQRNWIAASLWRAPGNLYQHMWLLLEDFDQDGRQDLLAGGHGGPQSPNLRILFGASGGFTQAGLVQLSNGLFPPMGDRSQPTYQGADVGPVVSADFNNDGLPDIFAMEEQVLNYQPGAITDTNLPDYEWIRGNGGVVYADVAIHVLMNGGSRKFVDVTGASTQQNLGRRFYPSLFVLDMNNDGFLDVVGNYLTKLYAGVRTIWGTTLFLNDGTGAFQVLDGSRFLPATTAVAADDRWNLGAFVPTVVNRERTEGVVYEPVGRCGGPSWCAAPSLNIYRAYANSALGTGPDFADSAALGVPGFNEFYYLRHYADAAAAVQRRDFRSGLEHYLAVGRDKGYKPNAASAR